MLGLRHAHRRTVPVHVCRRSPTPPLAHAARHRRLGKASHGPCQAGAMMAWSARPLKAGPRRNYRRAPSGVNLGVQFFVTVV
eukprot:scaffold60828_cov54-Phaeocystis_antarctica.AAC.2